MIRLLRFALPASIQRNWDRFCLKIALPLSEVLADVPLKDGQFLFTRRWLDRTLLRLAFFSLLVGSVAAWGLHNFRFLTFPLVPLVIWPMRLTIPRKGVRCEKAFVKPDWGPLAFLLIWGVMSAAAFMLLPKTDFGAVCFIVFWLAGAPFYGHWLDRRRKSREEAMAPPAAEEWDRLEKPLGESDAGYRPSGNGGRN